MKEFNFWNNFFDSLDKLYAGGACVQLWPYAE